MEELLRKARALAGMGVTWGAAWAAIGAGIGLAIRVLSPEAAAGADPVIEWAIGMGLYGLVSGVGFGKVLAIYGRRKTLGDLTLPQVALWGVAGSAAVPLLFGALGFFEWDTTTADVVGAIVTTGVLGGSFAAAPLALARKAGGTEDGWDAEGRETGPGLLGGEPLPDPITARQRTRDGAPLGDRKS